MLRDPAADHIEDWLVLGSCEVFERLGNSLKEQDRSVKRH